MPLDQQWELFSEHVENIKCCGTKVELQAASSNLFGISVYLAVYTGMLNSVA